MYDHVLVPLNVLKIYYRSLVGFFSYPLVLVWRPIFSSCLDISSLVSSRAFVKDLTSSRNLALLTLLLFPPVLLAVWISDLSTGRVLETFLFTLNWNDKVMKHRMYQRSDNNKGNSLPGLFYLRTLHNCTRRFKPSVRVIFQSYPSGMWRINRIAESCDILCCSMCTPLRQDLRSREEETNEKIDNENEEVWNCGEFLIS